uniref:Uncharacterized protein n=1 Tax=Trichogramma kaykai TaxID=54128 RepID=A0ABD2X7J1_9HYME
MSNAKIDHVKSASMSSTSDFDWAFGLNRWSFRLIGLWLNKEDRIDPGKDWQIICTALMVLTGFVGPELVALHKVLDNFTLIIDNICISAPSLAALVQLLILRNNREAPTDLQVGQSTIFFLYLASTDQILSHPTYINEIQSHSVFSSQYSLFYNYCIVIGSARQNFEGGQVRLAARQTGARARHHAQAGAQRPHLYHDQLRDAVLERTVGRRGHARLRPVLSPDQQRHGSAPEPPVPRAEPVPGQGLRDAVLPGYVDAAHARLAGRLLLLLRVQQLFRRRRFSRERPVRDSRLERQRDRARTGLLSTASPGLRQRSCATHRNSELATAAFQSNWHSLPSYLSRDMVMIMMLLRSKVLFKLSIGKFIYLSLNTYIKIIKTSFGYMSVLLAVYN